MLNNKYYALKEIPKKKITKFNQIYAILNEPHILKKLIGFKFITKIISSFQDFDNLYLVTNLYEGDILNKYKNENMSEKEIKFIIACIIQSLEYLREKEIINRDVRMKNLILDKKKYLNLIDFSFAIKYSEKNNANIIIVGHKNESAPEILNHQDYDYNSDYYRIGTILYYLIFKNYVNDVKKRSNLNEFVIDYKNISNYSSNCFDFLNKLIIIDYKKRIGFQDINELKNHKWFNGFDWKNFEKKKIKSPLKFKEKKFNKNCFKYFVISKKKKNIHFKYEKNKIYKKLIKKYEYVNENIIKTILKSYFKR